MSEGPTIAVHGGAWNVPREERAAHVAGCERALDAGAAVLRDGGSALDAVVAAVKVLEDDPTFDAGRGAVLNANGDVEFDAGVMDSSMRVGAVGAARSVRYPIELAREILERLDATLIVGEAALELAVAWELERMRGDWFETERELRRFEQLRAVTDHRLADPFRPGDTVGAVARDANGGFAAGTSTGGAPLKPPGRVGDSPIPGAGFYALRDVGAASSTGHGESILLVSLALRAVEALERDDAAEAARRAIDVLARRTGEFGGLILVGPTGPPSFACNTEAMAVAWLDADGVPRSRVDGSTVPGTSC